MSVDRTQFVTVFLVGNLLFLGVVVGIVSAGVAVAVPTAGVGGFTVEFDELQGEGFTQYPSVGNNSECAAYPSAVAQINSGTIKGLHLYKDIEIPDSIPGGGQTLRLSIKSDETVQFSGLTQKFTYLTGDLTFSEGQQIGQSPSGDVSNRLSLSSPAITIADGAIKAQSQFVKSITLTGSTVETSMNPEESADFPKSVCAVPNNETGS
ncbi:DUF6230 family protein [Halobacteriales archaeon Cl-PHB]